MLNICLMKDIMLCGFSSLFKMYFLLAGGDSAPALKDKTAALVVKPGWLHGSQCCQREFISAGGRTCELTGLNAPTKAYRGPFIVLQCHTGDIV